MNIYLKSGTNTLRGSGYGYFRDDAWDATDSITKSRGLNNPPFFRRQWGGSVGGPIRKNRTFYFGTVERQNYERTSVTSSDAEVAAALGLSAASGELNAIDTSIKLTGKLDHNLGNNSQLVFRYRLRQHIPWRYDYLWKCGPGAGSPEQLFHALLHRPHCIRRMESHHAREHGQ